ncbi:MAG: hypothetical protein LQ343_007008 [Gyalolechia ehrenbergii]|nr:MAG: hypothetical protein LQ343_007008 [Gyalolechia ehrenbergii]
MTRPTKMNARSAPTGPPSAIISPEVKNIPIPTAAEKAIPGRQCLITFDLNNLV